MILSAEQGWRAWDEVSGALMRAELALMVIGHGQSTLARTGFEVMVHRRGTGEAFTADDTLDEH